MQPATITITGDAWHRGEENIRAGTIFNKGTDQMGIYPLWQTQKR